MNTRVSFEISKKLLGRYPGISGSYNCIGEQVVTGSAIRRLTDEVYYPRPTISEVIMWLYNEYGIWIEAQKSYTGGFFPVVRELRIFLEKCASPIEAYLGVIEYLLDGDFCVKK